jgi:hypothetical protein
MTSLPVSLPFLKGRDGEVLRSPLVHEDVVRVAQQDEVAERFALGRGHARY